MVLGGVRGGITETLRGMMTLKVPARVGRVQQEQAFLFVVLSGDDIRITRPLTDRF